MADLMYRQAFIPVVVPLVTLVWVFALTVLEPLRSVDEEKERQKACSELIDAIKQITMSLRKADSAVCCYGYMRNDSQYLKNLQDAQVECSMIIDSLALIDAKTKNQHSSQQEAVYQSRKGLRLIESAIAEMKGKSIPPAMVRIKFHWEFKKAIQMIEFEPIELAEQNCSHSKRHNDGIVSELLDTGRRLSESASEANRKQWTNAVFGILLIFSSAIVLLNNFAARVTRLFGEGKQFQNEAFRKGLVPVLAPLIGSSLFTLIMVWHVHDLQEVVYTAARRILLRAQVDRFVEIGFEPGKAFLDYAISKDQRDLDRYVRSKRVIANAAESVRAIVSESPALCKEVDALEKMALDNFRATDAVLALIERQEVDVAQIRPAKETSENEIRFNAAIEQLLKDCDEFLNIPADKVGTSVPLPVIPMAVLVLIVHMTVIFNLQRKYVVTLIETRQL